MNERLCIVMPVYNEEEAIGGVLEKWSGTLRALGIDFTIRPYNDGSRDSSLQVMRDFAEAHPDAHIEVRDKPNGGHGNTILTGYREAVVDGFDWVFQIDSDDEMGPECFGELWSHRADYDFLVGIRDGRVQALPRKVISFVSRCCVKTFYGRNTIWDVNTPYRLMRVSAFAPIFAQIPLTTFAPNVIISGMVAHEHLRYFEARVPQHDRTTGEVSIKKWKLLKAAIRSFMQTILFSLEHCHYLWPLIAILAFTACRYLALSPAFHLPSSDNQVFMWVAKCMCNGGVMYRDCFDHKGPVFLFINYLCELVNSDGWCIWAVDALFSLAALSSLYMGIRRRISAKAAFCLTLGLALIPLYPNYPEHFAVQLSLFSLGLLLISNGATWAFACTGILGALVFFSKQTNIGFFVAVGIWLLFNMKRKEYRKAFVSYIFSGIGAMAVIACVLCMTGIWSDYLYACFTFNRIYGGVNIGKLHRCISTLPVVWPMFLLAFAVLLSGYRTRIKGTFIIATIAYAAWEYIFFILGQGPCGYQYEPLLVPFWLSMAALFASPCNDEQKIKDADCRYAYLVLGIVFCFFVFFAWKPLKRSAFEVYHKLCWHNRADGDTGRDATAELATQLNAFPKADLFVWGIQPRLYWLTGRESPFKPHYQWISWSVDPRSEEQAEEQIKKSEFILLDLQDGFSLTAREEEPAQGVVKLLLRHMRDEMKEVPCNDRRYRLYVPKRWTINLTDGREKQSGL